MFKFRKGYLFTSDAYSAGNADIICDVIADTIKDYFLEVDRDAFVDIDVCIYKDIVQLMGRVDSTENTDYGMLQQIVNFTVAKLGYETTDTCFGTSTNCPISPANFITELKNVGKYKKDAQIGTVFGYACDETAEYIPLTMKVAREIVQELNHYARLFPDSVIRPDVKAQVTVAYKKGVLSVDTVSVNCSHAKDASEKEINDMVYDAVSNVLSENGNDIRDLDTLYINKSGDFSEYGPDIQVGHSNSKLCSVMYGGHSRIGDTALSGKDNSAVLMARYAAKNLVATGFCTRAELQLSYVDGIDNPISINLNLYGSNKEIPTGVLTRVISKVFNFSKKTMADSLGLKEPDHEWNYADCAEHGWFGRENLPWESLDKVEEIKEQVSYFMD